MSSTGVSRRRQIFFSTVLVVFGLGFALVAGELMMRLVDPPLFNSSMRVYDPELGWRSIPNKVLHRPMKKRVVRFAVNEAGFRDREHNVARAVGGQAKPRPIRRIMIFGDSFTESAQVELHETFWSLLKDRLNSRQDSVYWEVQSFGVGDWGTTQQWLAYQKYGQIADLVILQTFPLNDIINNSLAGANLASSQDAYRPYLDPETQYRYLTYVNPRASWLRRHSKLARFLIQISIKNGWSWAGEKHFKTLKERFAYSDERARELGLGEDAKFPALLFNALTYDPEQFELVRQGWKATDMSVRRIANLSKRRKAKMMVVVIPHIDQLAPHNEKLKKLPFTVRPTYAEDRLAKLLEKETEIPVVPLVEPLEANMDIVWPYLEGHFNRPTHHLVAELLEQEVLKLFPD